MAKYTVTHPCGHASDITLYGKGAERERRLRWLAAQPCRDCLIAEELRRAETKAEKDQLPELVGSEKQIAWAERIRYETLLVIERSIPHDQLDDEALIPERLAFEPGETVTVRAIVERIRRQSDCRWWIDKAKRVHDIGRVPLYGERDFLAELLPAAAYGHRIPTTDDLARSDDVRKQLRGVFH